MENNEEERITALEERIDALERILGEGVVELDYSEEDINKSLYNVKNFSNIYDTYSKEQIMTSLNNATNFENVYNRKDDIINTLDRFQKFSGLYDESNNTITDNNGKFIKQTENIFKLDDPNSKGNNTLCLNFDNSSLKGKDNVGFINRRFTWSNFDRLENMTSLEFEFITKKNGENFYVTAIQKINSEIQFYGTNNTTHFWGDDWYTFAQYNNGQWTIYNGRESMKNIAFLKEPPDDIKEFIIDHFDFDPILENTNQKLIFSSNNPISISRQSLLILSSFDIKLKGKAIFTFKFKNTETNEEKIATVSAVRDNDNDNFEWFSSNTILYKDEFPEGTYNINIYVNLDENYSSSPSITFNGSSKSYINIIGI